MKNQYFGDISDYRKYGLLRCLAEADLRVGVIWMLTPDDTRSDGQRTDYLSDRSRWRHFDPPLFDLLAEAVANGGREVSTFERSDLLPQALFHSALLEDDANARRSYFAEAKTAMAGADVVFLDPDNGLPVNSVPYGAAGSRRYVYWSEIDDLWDTGHSLLIFQHFNRKPRAAFTESVIGELAARTPGSTVASGATSHVLFLAAAQPPHAEAISSGLRVARKRWAGQLI